MRNVKLTAIIQREGNGFVSLCPERDIANEGDTREEAQPNLNGAVEGFLGAASPAELQRRLSAQL